MTRALLSLARWIFETDGLPALSVPRAADADGTTIRVYGSIRTCKPAEILETFASQLELLAV